MQLKFPQNSLTGEHAVLLQAMDHHAAISVMDGDGFITYVNDTFVKLSGFPRQELIGKTHWMLGSGFHCDSSSGDVWTRISSGETWSGEARGQSRNGEFFWIKSSIQPIIEQGQRPKGFITIGTDITEIKKDDSQRIFRDSFDFLQDEVYIFWPDTFALAYLNHAALKQVGWQETETAGRFLWDLNDFFKVHHSRFSKDNLPDLMAELLASDTGQIVYDFDGDDGRVFQAHLQIVEPADYFTRIVVFFHDITKQKQGEKAAREYGSTLDLIQNAVYVLDPVTTRISYANQAAITQSEWSREELYTMTPMGMIPKSLIDNFVAETTPLMSGEAITVNFETQMLTKSGRVVPVAASLKYMSVAGEDHRIVAVVQNISDLVAANREIQNFKTCFDLGQDDVYMFWADSLEYLYMNHAAMRRSGCLETGFHGKTPRDHLSKIEFDSFLRRAKTLLDGERETLVYEVYDNAHGVSLDVTLQLIRTEGEAARFFAIYRDIHERKAAETEINQLKSSLDMIHVDIYMYRPDTLRFIYMNQSGMWRLGWSEDVYRMKSVADLVPNFDETRFRARIAPLLAGDLNSISFETGGPRGEILDVTEQLIELAGESPRIVTMIRDVTAQREAQKVIESFKKILDTTSDLVFILHPKTLQFSYLNRAALDHFGWRDDEFEQYTLADASPPDFTVEKFLHRAVDLIEGREQTIIYETSDKDGHPFETNLQLIDLGGREPRFVSINRDLTERREIERRKNEFVATISHELRTPLTSIKGALGLIDSGAIGEIPDKALRLIGIALKNSDQLMHLINDILDLEKIESGKLEFDIRSVSVSELLIEAVETNTPYAANLGCTLKITANLTGANFLGDRYRLNQVMNNLLSNAAKFSEKGGEIELRAEQNGAFIDVYVRDYGRGIPLKAQATIFERFTQGDSSDRREKQGTGLGLSIAKLIVDSLEGELSFTSTPGEGTEFRIRMRAI